ncbi:hypothetical protein D3C85_1501600 [compost metagenome]
MVLLPVGAWCIAGHFFEQLAEVAGIGITYRITHLIKFVLRVTQQQLSLLDPHLG